MRRILKKRTPKQNCSIILIYRLHPATNGTDALSEVFAAASTVRFVASGILNIGIVRIFSVGASMSTLFFFPSRYSHSQHANNRSIFNHSQYRAVASLALSPRVTYRLYIGRCLICTHIFYTSLPIGFSDVDISTLLAYVAALP